MSPLEQASGCDTVLVRTMRAEDSAAVAAAFAAQGWHKPEAQYTRYLDESARKRRDVLLAERAGEFAGYVTIVWESEYQPFREAGIPEIVDFNVLIKHQRCGVGTALLDEAERRIAERSPIAGIGVGLTADYGAAQVLYIKRGYIPDGRGLVQNGQAIRHGERITVDDDLAIYFTKRL
jgi:ribosomal protein S18 acetylase RimI-like enzyme